MQRFTLGALLFLMTLQVGCIVWENESKEPEPAEGYAFASCGPADGPAIDVFIPETAIDSCAAIASQLYQSPPAFTHTRIFLYGFPDSYPESAGTFYFGRDQNPQGAQGSAGWAGLCQQGETECLEAKSGSILLPSADTEDFETEVIINYLDGTTYTRPLRLQWCAHEEPLICG